MTNQETSPDRRDAVQRVRTEIARELHDRVAQTLTAMVVDMENFKRDQYGRLSVIQELDLYQNATRDVLNNLRSLLFELRDSDQTASDFVDRVRALVREFEARSGIRASLNVAPGWPQRMAAQAANHMHRIVGEGLNNVRLHSGANRVSVRLRCDDAQMAVIEIKDDGQGTASSPGPAAGFGLLGMRERAVLLGGELRLITAARHGTTLVATFPVRNLL